MHLMEQAALSQLVQDQLAHPEINVFTGRTFEEERENAGSGFDFSRLISVDEEAMRNAFAIDPSAFQIDTSGLNFEMSGINIDPSAIMAGIDLSNINLNIDPGLMQNIQIPEMDTSAMMNTIASSLQVDPNALMSVMAQVMQGFFQAEGVNMLLPGFDFQAAFTAYLSRPDVQAQIQESLSQLVDPTKVQEAIQGALTAYMQAAMADIMTQMGGVIQEAMQTQMQAIMEQISWQIGQNLQAMLGNAFGGMQAQMETAFAGISTQLQSQIEAAFAAIDPSALADAFQMNMDEDTLLDLMNTMMNPNIASFDGNLQLLGYADINKPSQINLYPKNFEAKQEVIHFLDQYNEDRMNEGADDQVIRYTDLVGVMMSSVTDIIDMVSYALIAFVSISLVVSSIMIGVITYISVLERKKEIGILRAIGASKGNIKQIFNAETLIVGFVAGVLGILVTLVITSVGSMIVERHFDIAGIAVLPPNAALILILVSMFLTFIAGLIPASAAARKDPVEALRSE